MVTRVTLTFAIHCPLYFFCGGEVRCIVAMLLFPRLEDHEAVNVVNARQHVQYKGAKCDVCDVCYCCVPSIQPPFPLFLFVGYGSRFRLVGPLETDPCAAKARVIAAMDALYNPGAAVVDLCVVFVVVVVGCCCVGCGLLLWLWVVVVWVVGCCVAVVVVVQADTNASAPPRAHVQAPPSLGPISC